MPGTVRKLSSKYEFHNGSYVQDYKYIGISRSILNGVSLHLSTGYMSHHIRSNALIYVPCLAKPLGMSELDMT